MSILDLWHTASGYLVVSVHGAATEKFINMAVQRQIPLKDIRRGRDRAILKVDVDSFYELRHLARKTGCRLHIEKKAGFPFFCSRILRRRGLLAGAILFVALLYYLSSLVLFVSVEGTKRLDEARIVAAAKTLGIRPGLAKSRIDRGVLANELLLLEPDLAWVNVEIRGTRLVIQVVEKIRPIGENDRPADLVAAKDGLVVDVLVITGEARVRPGDTVTRGQLLIEGVLTPDAPPQVVEGEARRMLHTARVHARGEVRARVWYEGYAEAELEEVTKKRSGRRFSSLALVIDGQEVLRLGRAGISYTDYELERIIQRLPERILPVPVEIITENYYELKLRRRILSREQALEIAAERARALAELQLPAGARVRSSAVREVETGRQDLVGVRYVLETIEDIAKERPTGGD